MDKNPIELKPNFAGVGIDLKKVPDWLKSKLSLLFKKEKQEIEKHYALKMEELKKQHSKEISELKAELEKRNSEPRENDLLRQGYWIEYKIAITSPDHTYRFCRYCYNNSGVQNPIIGNDYVISCTKCGADHRIKDYPEVSKPDIPYY